MLTPANAAESDKRDLMKELETMKKLKKHPHVIKLLGCVTESGMFWLCRFYCAIRIFLINLPYDYLVNIICFKF